MKCIESVRHEAAIGEPPPRPEFFDHRYVLPVHGSNLLLQRLNKHPRDDRIRFEEEPHVYAVDGCPAGTSVSSLAHDFEEEFDPIKGIDMMKHSKREAWPRYGYVLDSCLVDSSCIDCTKGVLLYDTSSKKTVASLRPDTKRVSDYDKLKAYLIAAACTRCRFEDCQIYNFEREMSDDEIKAKWEANGEDARNRGTEAHLQMELWMNSLPCRTDDPETVIGLKFVEDQLTAIGAKAFRTEWEIFGEDEDVAGCIDLAVILPDGDLYLIDWKRSEKLPQKMKGYKKMKQPLHNLDSCSGCSYGLQLSAYQYIIEKYYGYKVKGRALVSLHPDAPFVTTVPNLYEEIKFIMETRRLRTMARKALEANPDYKHLCCSVTGRLMEDAVEDEEGNLCWIKSALLFQKTVSKQRPDISDRVKELLEQEAKPAPWPTNTVDWSQMYQPPHDVLL